MTPQGASAPRRPLGGSEGAAVRSGGRVLGGGLVVGRGGEDGLAALLVEDPELVGPLVRQVAGAAVDVAPHAGALLADLVLAGGVGVPPDLGHVVAAVAVVALPEA